MFSRGGLIAAAVGLGAVAFPSAGMATAFHRVCNSSNGAVSKSLRWVESGPYLIQISRSTDIQISRRVGRVATQPRPNDVPCWVANDGAFEIMNAWENWSGNTGVAGVQLTGESHGPLPYLGRFRCVGASTHAGGAVETCTHRADRHAGPIVLRFTISPAPKY